MNERIKKIIKLEVDLKVIELLVNYELSFEDLFILKIVKGDHLDFMTAYLTNKNADQKFVYFQKLVRKGLLEILLVDLDEFSLDNYKLSDIGIKILTSIENLDAIVERLEKEDITGIKEKVIVSEEKESQFDKFVQDFRNKFPEGKNGGNKSLKGNQKDVKDKLIKFINKYKYEQDIILTATELYLSGFRSKGFEFCQTAEYFILKDASSTLAGFCEMAKKNKEKGIGNIVNPWEQRM